MKQTTNINIGGSVLHIDEDAYLLLHQYIKRLEMHFQKYPEKADILGDIEQRIAELLCEEISSKEQAVTTEHVEKVIEIMGNPHDFEEEKENTQESEPTTNEKKNKQLYRNPKGKIIAGVAGGLGVYFKLDPVLIRVAFLIITLVGFGFPIPLYIILWILIPEAQTKTQRMEMMGEPINIESIKNQAQNGFENLKSSVKDFANADYTHNAISQVGSFIGKVLPVLFKIIFGLSVSIMAAGIVFLSIIELSSNVICWDFPPTMDPSLVHFLSNVDISLLGVGVLFVGLAAVTSIFHILPNVIWGENSSSKLALQITSVLTTIGIIIIIIALTKSIVDYQVVKEFIFLGGS